MIPLAYQNPRHVAPPKKTSVWQLFFAGAMGATLCGFLVWLFLLHIWPDGQWQILGPPDMIACLPLDAAFWSVVSAAIYGSIASRAQIGDRHIIHGIIAGLYLTTVTNFMQRADDAGIATSGVLGVIYIGSILATAIALGFLSRRYAKKQTIESGA